MQMADNLYCPRCAKPFEAGTSFCRTCGLQLGGVAEIVRGDANNAPLVSNKPNFAIFRVGIGLLLLATLAGLLNAMLRDYGLYPERYAKSVVFIILIASVVTMASAVLFPAKKYTERPRIDVDPAQDRQRQIDTAPVPGRLTAAERDVDAIDFSPSQREPVGVVSVTENTTRKLQ